MITRSDFFFRRPSILCNHVGAGVSIRFQTVSDPRPHLHLQTQQTRARAVHSVSGLLTPCVVPHELSCCSSLAPRPTAGARVPAARGPASGRCCSRSSSPSPTGGAGVPAAGGSASGCRHRRSNFPSAVGVGRGDSVAIEETHGSRCQVRTRSPTTPVQRVRRVEHLRARSDSKQVQGVRRSEHL